MDERHDKSKFGVLSPRSKKEREHAWEATTVMVWGYTLVLMVWAVNTNRKVASCSTFYTQIWVAKDAAITIMPSERPDRTTLYRKQHDSVVWVHALNWPANNRNLSQNIWQTMKGKYGQCESRTVQQLKEHFTFKTTNWSPQFKSVNTKFS